MLSPYINGKEIYIFNNGFSRKKKEKKGREGEEGKKKERISLICCICQFLYFKYSRCGGFQAINLTLPGLQHS